MKTWLNSIIFPTILIIVLAIFTFWFNKITLLEDKFLPFKNQYPMTTMHDANIQSFSINGELENDVYASKVSQKNNSNSFVLEDSNITRYKNGKIIQNITAKEASFDDDTKYIHLNSGLKKDKIEIIIREL